MLIKEKQFNYLNRLLKNYELKKDINLLTPFEASVIIEGILNSGKVKNTHNNKILSDEEHKKKQRFFDNLVTAKSIYATEKQVTFIIGLCESSSYKLKGKNILKQHVNDIISLLRDGKESEIAMDYLEKVAEKEKKSLVSIKEIKEEEKPDLPEEWILYDVKINGIIDF